MLTILKLQHFTDNIVIPPAAFDIFKLELYALKKELILPTIQIAGNVNSLFYLSSFQFFRIKPALPDPSR